MSSGQAHNVQVRVLKFQYRNGKKQWTNANSVNTSDIGEYRIPNALLDVGRPTTQGPFAMPDYYFELRHQQLAAMQSALEVFMELRKPATLAALEDRNRLTAGKE